MSAELLRRAAQKLRKRAGAATPGPWQAVQYGKGWGVDGNVRPADHAWVAEMKFGEERTDAEYIASMHPPVALALAGWLDFVAEHIEVRSGQRAGPAYVERAYAHPVAVARAVLREPTGEEVAR